MYMFLSFHKKRGFLVINRETPVIVRVTLTYHISEGYTYKTFCAILPTYNGVIVRYFIYS